MFFQKLLHFFRQYIFRMKHILTTLYLTYLIDMKLLIITIILNRFISWQTLQKFGDHLTHLFILFLNLISLFTLQTLFFN